LGQLCNDDDPSPDAPRCVTGLFCNEGHACERWRDVGAACEHRYECATDACSSDKKCAQIEWIGPGGECDSNTKKCARGTCETADYTSPVRKCVDARRSGAPCDANSGHAPYCDEGLTCLHGTCQVFDPAVCK